MTRNRNSVTLALTALALAGCVNLAPDHVQPELSTRPAYDPEYRPDGTVIASELAWQDFFADPRLRALIQVALDNNRDLVAATARVEQARAQFRIEDSDRLPNVGASASATRSRTSLQSLSGTDTDSGGSVTNDRLQVGVASSSFELDFWSRIKNQSEAARAQYLATEAAQRSFYLSLIGDVASTYYQLVETHEQIELAEATAESRREGLRIAQLRLDGGVTSALPYRQSETLLTQAEQELAAQRLSEAQLRNQLAVLVGGRIPQDLPDGLPLEVTEDEPMLAAGLPSDLLLVPPDIIAAEENLRAARANIGAARAAFFPTISLTGNAGFASNSLGNLFGGDSLTWSFGPSIDLPIFDWGAREAQLDLASALEVEEVANYDLTVQNAFREVSDALAARRWLAEQVATLERGQAAQAEIARIARARYREGVADYLEVLDAERNLFSAQQALLSMRRANRQNSAALYIALGGGQGELRAD